METVTEILNKNEQQRNEAIESIKVNKLIPLELYPKDLLIIDTNEINLSEYRTNKEDHLRNLARDCVQHLVNALSEYPKETKDGKIFIKINEPAFSLPREKPIPVPKPLTKWQKFAKEKGIRKIKKPRTTWDDILQKWIPTYGYKKAAAEKEKNWLIEVPQNVDPRTDMFAEKAKVKKENIAKNEYQRLRNIAASKKIKVPKVAVPPMEGNLHVSQLQLAADITRVSTASVGKFPVQDEQKAEPKGKKRKRSKKRQGKGENKKFKKQHGSKSKSQKGRQAGHGRKRR